MIGLTRLLTILIEENPSAFARPFMPPGAQIEVSGWFQPRGMSRTSHLHRTLLLKVNGKPRLLHTRFQIAPSTDVALGIFDVHTALARQLFEAGRGLGNMPITSALVQLAGDESLVPRFGAIRTSAEDEAFAGVRYRIEPLYQMSTRQLRRRGRHFWTLFSPLTRDATEDTLLGEMEALSRSTTSFERLELSFAFMARMADLDGRARGLREPIEAYWRRLSQTRVGGRRASCS